MNDQARAHNVHEKIERLQVMLVALGDGTKNLGPLFQIIEKIEQSLDPLPGALGHLESTLSDLGIDEEDLPLGVGQKAHTLKLAMAISKEFGKKLPLDKLLGVLPGIPGNMAEKGLLLPVALGLASAYRTRTDPALLAKRIERLRHKRDRLRHH